MIQFFKDVRIDWLANRRIFIAISVLLMLVGLASAVYRQAFHPNGTEAFNLGIDFKGGTVITAQVKERPSAEVIHDALAKVGVADAIIQPIADKPTQVLLRRPQQQAGEAQDRSQVDAGASKVREALNTFGPETKGDLNAEPQAAYKILGTDAVGPVAGRQLRNQAIALTLLARLGLMMYIA